MRKDFGRKSVQLGVSISLSNTLDADLSAVNGVTYREEEDRRCFRGRMSERCREMDSLAFEFRCFEGFHFVAFVPFFLLLTLPLCSLIPFVLKIFTSVRYFSSSQSNLRCREEESISRTLPREKRENGG